MLDFSRRGEQKNTRIMTIAEKSRSECDGRVAKKKKKRKMIIRLDNLSNNSLTFNIYAQ